MLWQYCLVILYLTYRLLEIIIPYSQNKRQLNVSIQGQIFGGITSQPVTYKILYMCKSFFFFAGFQSHTRCCHRRRGGFRNSQIPDRVVRFFWCFCHQLSRNEANRLGVRVVARKEIRSLTECSHSAWNVCSVEIRSKRPFFLLVFSNTSH